MSDLDKVNLKSLDIIYPIECFQWDFFVNENNKGCIISVIKSNTIILLPMNEKFTPEQTVKTKIEELSPKNSTLSFLMAFARAYSCNNKAISSTGGLILN